MTKRKATRRRKPPISKMSKTMLRRELRKILARMKEAEDRWGYNW